MTYEALAAMCSTSRVFPAFSCAHAADRCQAGIAWLWVGAADSLAPLYEALGFTLLLCMPL